MKKRGIEDMELVMVDAWGVGYYSAADGPQRRPLIFCRTQSKRPMENGYARPVEGLYILVDMQNMAVIEFEDRKLVPLPPADQLRNFTPGETRGGVDRRDVTPLQILQPQGPSFRVNGYFVEWQKWNFRIGFTPREGLVLYSVAYVDGSRGRRPVAHRKNAFDAGEDGLGKNAHSLRKEALKQLRIEFVCTKRIMGFCGSTRTRDQGLAQVRRSRRLTVSFMCTVANYEYGFFWHFYQASFLIGYNLFSQCQLIGCQASHCVGFCRMEQLKLKLNSQEFSA
ncbi:hypothetical protein GBA52_017350 [Prunus armeniaca]|nr:hypothetical protein GBA52_017350 [Prunus armeniaca]